MEPRPKLSSDENEIFRMQQEYLAGKIPISSTQVVMGSRKSTSIEKDSNPPKKSLFAQKRAKEKGNYVPPAFEFTKFQVLKDVVEKVDGAPSSTTAPTSKRSAFPEAFKLEKSIKAIKGSSIFSQQIKKAKPSQCYQKDVGKNPSFGECSSIIQAVLGDAEAARLHKENLEKLASMSEDEILHEQQQLMKSLDPKLVSFLRSKKTLKPEAATIQDTKTVPMEIEPQCEEEPEAIQELKKTQWVHMDKVEKEKTRWMTSLPPIKELAGKSFQARFDFNGNLLPVNADLPTSSALYHHGEEPERAGYSINELMFLSRSSKIQQRVLALNTLGKVLEQARIGTYDSCFEAPLIPTLLDHGILLLLRYCLDDNKPAVVTAALVAFSNLLSCPFEETCLERCFLWYGGEEQPDLYTKVQLDEQDKEQEEEMKDDETAAFDVIKACLRMNVPFRIRYILEEIQPESRGVLAALSILTRIARHSLESAITILNFPRLFKSIFKFFLPKDWQTLTVAQGSGVADSIYGLPVRQVLRLAQVIASWKPELAHKLVKEFSLLESIKTYIAMETANLKLPTKEGLLLVLDSYHTWRTLLRQGIGIEDFIEFYPIWIPQLRLFQSSISIEGAENSSNVKFSHQLGTSMLLMMEAFVGTCCRSESGQHLHFGQVGGLREIIELCVAKWSWQQRQSTDPIPESSACLLAAAFHFLATFYTHWVDSQTPFHLDDLCSSHVLPLLQTEQMNELAYRLIKHSNFITAAKPFLRSPDALPCLNATVVDGQTVPVVLPSTPFPLPTAIFRFLRVWEKKSSAHKVAQLELSQPYLEYLRKIALSSSALGNNWFTRYEIWFLHELLMLCAMVPTVSSEYKQILHRVALTTCSSIPIGHSWIAADWMASIVFNRNFFEKESELETLLERFQLTESQHHTLLSEAFANLAEIAAFYVSQFYEPRSTQLVFKPQQIFPDDWIYAPLVALYTYSDNQKVKFTASPKEMALRSSQASFIFLSTRTSFFFRIRPSEHYVRLACIFLASSDLFLDEQICSYIWPVLRGISARHFDFAQPVEGVQDLLGFYDKLIVHFKAVSYGSPLFGAFLLLPARQTEPLSFRTKLWCEHTDALRCISITCKQLPAPVREWLEPLETDEILLEKYAACIKQGFVNSQRNPAVYAIANHHLYNRGG